MINDIKEFQKIQEQCSNVFLLDENLCLGNSYQVINHNIISLSSALNSFQSTINYFNQNFTYFLANSSKYLEINNNLNQGFENFNNLYTLVNSNSANWTRPIGVFYNEILLVSDWNANKFGVGSNYPQNKFLTWLTNNFPPSNFTSIQTITLHITLYNSVPFRFDAGFSKTFNEKCYIEPYPVEIKCGVNTCTVSSGSSCNYTTAWGTRACGDPINGCYRSAGGGYSGPVSCPTTGGKQLTISHQKTNYDTHTSTSLGLRYKKNSTNTSWEYVSQI
jgi:hypothetical protein